MSAPLRLPVPQDGSHGFPDLRVPRRGWRHSPALGDSRVFRCRVGGYRLTITETSDGRLTGTLSDPDRLWLLSDHSTLIAWMAAVQCLAH